MFIECAQCRLDSVPVPAYSPKQGALRLSAAALKQTICLGLCMMVCGMLVGCGGRREARPSGLVSGNVTFAGKPLATGRVNFISEALGAGASGTLNADGSYTLEGPIPVGDYRAYVTFNIPPSKVGTPEGNVLKAVPKKYQAMETSGLEFQVKEGKNQLLLELK
ncbi:carboxypeptidase-like regulatory domain-containing protein [Planctomicrobium sp. SH661]|uniref:carboxypeptidase-like regulatory domain-containing protein n=1 Tax=Planctomicrobium sp. SH661 TaxID=3448124 RepID=UPI003F5BA62E